MPPSASSPGTRATEPVGFFDRFKRKPERGWVDPSTVDAEESLRLARDGLAETGTYIDEHGNRRTLPEGAKDPVAEAIEQAEQTLGRDPGDQ